MIKIKIKTSGKLCFHCRKLLIIFSHKKNDPSCTEFPLTCQIFVMHYIKATPHSVHPLLYTTYIWMEQMELGVFKWLKNRLNREQSFFLFISPYHDLNASKREMPKHHRMSVWFEYFYNPLCGNSTIAGLFDYFPPELPTLLKIQFTHITR